MPAGRVQTAEPTKPVTATPAEQMLVATLTPAPTGKPSEVPGVKIGDQEFIVELAETTAQRTQGLSGRDSLPPNHGMLFAYERPGVHAFWMKDMRFSLDLIWIGEDCTVESITADAPAPDPEQSDGDLPRYRPVTPVPYILEINGGASREAKIEAGSPVTFTGSLVGKYEC